ncbi:hypothetical protein BH09BAC5_BH09BAC5_29510 [soil metagenome]
MKVRLFVLIVFLSGILFSFTWTGNTGATHSTDSHQTEILKKKKKKKRKKPKKQKEKKKKVKKKKTDDSAKRAKKKRKADKRHEKNQGKLDKKNEKKAKEIQKAQDDRKEYTKCDSADVIRTSQDTAILVKYIKIYRSLGGVCYIIHLQKMAKLINTSDGFYSVQMKESKDPRAPAAWQTYLYCPIGKPNGTIALLDPLGDTIQMCSYLNEKKEGMMYYVKKGKGVIYKEKYAADNKVWEKKEDDDN